MGRAKKETAQRVITPAEKKKTEALIKKLKNQMKALDKLKAEYEEYKKKNPEFRIESLEDKKE